MKMNLKTIAMSALSILLIAGCGKGLDEKNPGNSGNNGNNNDQPGGGDENTTAVLEVEVTKDKEACQADETVTFTSVVTGGYEPYTYTWDFGDSKTSNLACPQISWSTPGLKNITLIVVDSKGNTTAEQYAYTKQMIVTEKQAVADPNKGTGTQTDPYQIETPQKWNEIALSMKVEEPQSVYSPTAYYKLTADLNFQDVKFSTWEKFDGQLDGNGMTIKNVTASYSSTIDDDGHGFGLISKTGGPAVIKNLKVNNVSFTSNQKWVGSVVGYNAGEIDKVYVTNSTLEGLKYVGGISGTHNGNTLPDDRPVIMNCGVENITITNNGEASGMITGGVVYGALCINSYAWGGSITVTKDNNNHGGLVGYMNNQGLVVNCYSTTTSITGSSASYAGGVGWANAGNIQNIYANDDCSKSGDAAYNGSGTPKTISKRSAALLKIDNMKSGAVTVPSSSTSKSSFVEALNAGITIYNNHKDENTGDVYGKPDVTGKLSSWKKDATTGLPVHL